VGAVFISYRRGDSEGQARALFIELADIVGKDSVFMDVDSIDLGRDFRSALQERLASCDLMLTLIGPGWLDAKDASGSRRLESPTDFVRQEIAAALRRNIPVTPVLLQGASIPGPDRLPEDIRDLAYRNGFELSHNRWESDVTEMLKRLGVRRRDPVPNMAAKAAGSRAKYWVAAGLAAVLVLAAWNLFQSPVQVPDTSDSSAASSPVANVPAAEPTSAPESGSRAPASSRVPRAETPAAVDVCLQGFVWREASPEDRVCVSVETRSQTAEENRLAASRRSPTGGAYGPDTCLQGFVWRDAFAGDVVCVSPESRQRAAEDNALAQSRRAL
jgi:hypothetical protein